MKINIKQALTGVAACALTAMMVVSPMTAFAQETNVSAWNQKILKKTGGVEAIKTSISSEKEVVTVTVDIAANTGITSGQTVVYYDKNELEYQWVDTPGVWEMGDVNEAYVSDDKTGISYAWVSQDPSLKSGTIITICFKAKQAENGKKINVETAVNEAFTRKESAITGTVTNTSTVELNIQPTQIGPITVPPGSPVDDMISSYIIIRKRIGTFFKGIFG